MNKQHARAWDEVTEIAERYDGVLGREGHRFFYAWSVPALDGLDEQAVSIWAEENAPCFGVRVEDVSARCWNIEAAERILLALCSTACPAQPPSA